MFAEIIQGNSFLSDRAENIWGGQINGDAYGNDRSFLALLRALLPKRIKDDEVVRYHITNADANYVNAAASDDSFLRELRFNNRNHTLLIRFLSGSEADRERAMKRIDERAHLFCAHELQDVKLFLRKAMDVRIYVNAEKKQTYIIVNGINIRKFHLLGALIPRYIPWFFADQPLNDLEKNLLSSMKDKESAKFKELIEVMWNSIDAGSFFINKCLRDFDKRSRRAELTRSIDEANMYRRDIDDIRRRRSELLRSLDAINVRIAGLEAMIKSGDSSSELVEYFCHNKHLVLMSSYDNEIRFVVNTYMDMVDSDMYESIMSNRHSFINNMSIDEGEFVHADKRKKFLDALFSSEPVLKLRTCAMYEINTRGDVTSFRNACYPPESDNYIPNPHLDYHNCLGDHERMIEAKLEAGDMIGAIEQCIASAKSMNINESTATSGPFLRSLMECCTIKCIELPDKTCVTPAQALAWLEAQEKGETESVD